jgi:hypothetical protein
MPPESPIEFGTTATALSPLPIRPEWILEGAPRAQAKVLSVSSDGTAKTVVWDCTAGRFSWFYDVDETIYVLEGSVAIKLQDGAVRQVNAGDTIFFRAGSHAEWTVDKYIRKVAFFRTPVPAYALLAMKVGRLLARLAGSGPAKSPLGLG